MSNETPPTSSRRRGEGSWSWLARRQQLLDCFTNGRDRLEGLTAQEPLRKLQVEGVLQREHQVDAGMGGQPGSIQIVVVRQPTNFYWQTSVLCNDLTNLVGHGCSFHSLPHPCRSSRSILSAI